MGKLNLKYGILTFGLVAVATASVMPGCSADGVTGGTDEDSGTVIDATTGGGEDATIDSTTSSSGGQDAAKDAPSDAKKDVTVVDSGSDAAKDASSDASDGGGAPAPGSACPTPGVTFQRTCGFCGKQEAVCEGTNLVSAYGPCSGEVANGCLPGSTRQTACGLCGTKSEICQNNCQWSSGLCGGEPMNACAPGSVQYTTGGCSEPNTFRKQTCSAQCQYGAPAPLPCLPKDGDITISNAVGGIVSGEFDLSPLNDQIPRIYSGACPQTFSPSSSSMPRPEPRAISSAWPRMPKPVTSVMAWTVSCRARSAPIRLSSVVEPIISA